MCVCARAMYAGCMDGIAKNEETGNDDDNNVRKPMKKRKKNWIG